MLATCWPKLMCLVWATGNDDGQNLETITNGMVRHLSKKKTSGDMSLSMARHGLVHRVQITTEYEVFF